MNTDVYKVVGLRVEKFVGSVMTGHNMDFTRKAKECERIVLCFQHIFNSFKYEISFELDESEECTSGWAVARYCHINKKMVENFGGLTHIPKEEIRLHTLPKCGMHKNIEIKDVNNRMIARGSYDGGDEYYPCGDFEVNMDLFKETPRNPKQRPTYVFFGPSGIGKSFLAHKIYETVYETDCSPELPEVLRYDLIVVGNKYPFTKEDIKARLPRETKMVSVDFSYVE